MDTTPVQNRSITASPQPENKAKAGGSDLARQLSERLGLKVAQTSSALVVKSEALSPQSQEEWVKQQQNLLKQLPAQGQAKLLDLISQPKLHLIEFSLPNQQRLFNVSAVNLQPGSEVQVRIRPDGQVQLLVDALQGKSQLSQQAKDHAYRAGLSSLSGATSNTLATKATVATTLNKAAALNTDNKLSAGSKPGLNLSYGQSSLPNRTSGISQNILKPGQTLNVELGISRQNNVQNSPLKNSNAGSDANLSSTKTNNADQIKTTLSQAQKNESGAKLLNSSVAAASSPALAKSEQNTGDIAGPSRGAITKIDIDPKQKDFLVKFLRARPEPEVSAADFAKTLVSITPLLKNLSVQLLDRGQQHAPLPTAVTQAVRNFLNTIANPDQLQNQTNFAKALANSGTFYERKLVEALSSDQHSSLHSKEDAKHLLQQIVSSVPVSELNSKLQTYQSLEKILFNLLMGGGAKNTEQTAKGLDLKKEFQVLLAALANKALDSLKTKQYQQVLSRSSEASSPLPFQVDFPIRFGEGIFNVFLQLEVKRKQKGEDSKKSKERKRQQNHWSIFLELELANTEKLAASMQLQDNELDAKLWASSEQLNNEAQAQMQELRKKLIDSGLEVIDLQCEEGSGPDKRQKLNNELLAKQNLIGDQ